VKKTIKKVMAIATVTAMISAGFSSTAWSVNYKIQKGDTLNSIAKKYDITVDALKQANNLSQDMIYVGNYLYIPENQYHKVVKGDSLYLIGKKYGVTPQSIKSLNGLKSDTIQVGQSLKIPKREVSLSYRGNSYSATKQEIDLLARVVHGEARGESMEGKVAVAAVVLNRLYDADFPNSIEGVIYEKLAFTAVQDGQINLTPDQEAYAAVRLALSGYDPSCGSLYYWNPRTSTSEWIWSRQVLLKIDNHLFGI